MGKGLEDLLGGDSKKKPTTTTSSAPTAGPSAGPKGSGLAGLLGDSPAPAKKNKGVLGKAKSVGGGLLGGVIEGLGALQQATFRTGSGLGELLSGNVKEGVGELGKGLAEATIVGGQFVDDIGFAEATTPVEQREQGLVRKLPKGVETAANLLLDPTLPTAVLKGAKGAKEALRVAEKAAGKDVAERIAKEGISSLSKQERTVLEAAVAESAAKVGASGGRRTLTEIGQGVKKPSTLGLQEGAERTAKKTLNALDRLEKAAPATAVGRFAQKAPSAAAHGMKLDKGLTAMKESKFGEWAADAIVPRAGITRNWGKEMAEKVKGFGSEKLANVARRSGDTLTETQARITRLGREVSAEDSKLLAAGLRGEDWAVQTLRGSDLNEVFEHLHELERVTGEQFGVLETAAKGVRAERKIKAAAIAPAHVEGESFAQAKLREILARRGTTPEAVRAAEEGGTAALPAGAKVEAPKAAKAPKALDDLTKNPITDEKPIQDVLNRHYQAIHAQEHKAYMQKMQRELVDPETGETLIKQLAKGDSIPEGMERLRSGYWGKGVAPKEIAREIDRIGNLLSDDKAIQAFDKFINKADRFWKTSLTSLPIGAAFSLRNMRSNLFLNWLDGLHTMKPYMEARAIQAKAGRVLAGKQFADEIAANGVRAVMKKNMTPREFRIWELADKKRVLGTNYFDIDHAFAGLAPEVTKIKGVATPGQKLGAVRKGGSSVAEAGKRFNSAIEDNAKLANFIHNLDRYGDADIAAQHVHKFLFDYSDLTKFEQGRVRKFIPFYTFMRKNVPLQIEQVWAQPGKINLRLEGAQMLTEDLPEGSPSYLERQQARVLPGPVGEALGVAGKVALSPDNPLAAASATVEPFTKLATALPSIVRGDAPDDMAAEVFRPVVSMIGGSRGSLLKLFMGEAAAKDMFTGAELNPQDARDRIIKTLVPFVARAQSLRLKTDEDRLPVVGSLIQQETKPGESVQQFLLRQAGIRTREVKKTS